MPPGVSLHCEEMVSKTVRRLAAQRPTQGLKIMDGRGDHFDIMKFDTIFAMNKRYAGQLYEHHFLSAACARQHGWRKKYVRHCWLYRPTAGARCLA